ncbi:hypothetical protein LguiA_009847 [Lonicera macranthoides]
MFYTKINFLVAIVEFAAKKFFSGNIVAKYIFAISGIYNYYLFAGIIEFPAKKTFFFVGNFHSPPTIRH